MSVSKFVLFCILVFCLPVVVVALSHSLEGLAVLPLIVVFDAFRYAGIVALLKPV